MGSEKTSKILGIITIVYSSITLVVVLAIVTLLVLVITQSGIKYMAGFSFSAYYTQLLIFSVYLITNVLWVVAGIALIKAESWARTLVIITSVLSIVQFPFGTVIGVVYFGFMFSRNIKGYYKNKRFVLNLSHN